LYESYYGFPYIKKKGRGAAAAASKSQQPVEDWRVKYGFKQPAPGKDDALSVLGRAIECAGVEGRDTVLGGELLWVQADLRLRLGEGLLARAERTSDSLSDGIEFSKVLSIVTLYSKSSWALTFENLYQANKTKCSRASASSFSTFLSPKAPPAKMRQPPRRKVKTMLRKLRMRRPPVPVPRLFPVRRS